MKRILCLFLCFLLLCGMTACGAAPGGTTSVQRPQPQTDDTIQIWKLGESFQESDLMKSGALIHTITDAKVISSLDGIPSTDCFLPEAFSYLNDQNEWELGELPPFVEEDGSFTGAYVILLDVTTTSNNAARYTVADLDSDGYPIGQYDDPYLFRVDTLGTLVALNHTGNSKDSYYPLGCTQYNSLYYHDPDLPDAHYSYHLEPGETIEYTIGFIIEENLFAAWDCEVDFSQLYFNTLGQVAPGKLIDLNLETA